MPASAEPRLQKFLPLPLLQAVTAYWILLKLGALFLGEPHADEAYYWMWGQHLALSYFDHAPLHAWLQGAMATLFGWTLFGLRFLTLLTTAATFYILYLWAKRLTPEIWRQTFWTSTALFYSTPVMLFYTTIATHDRLLVALGMASIHFFAWFFTDWSEGKRGRHAALYLAALFLGLATLTKYNGALIGVGVLLAILMRRDLRGLLLNPHLYLAALLSVALQFPTLYWNFTEGFPTLQLHLGSGRPNPLDLGNLSFDSTVRLLIESLVVVSPFALWGMLVFLVRPAGSGFRGMLHSVSRGTFIASTLFALLLSLTRYVLFYWNILAYAAFFGMAPLFLRSHILQVLQIGYGVVIGTLLMVQFGIFPVMQLIGFGQPQTNGLYGWPQVAERVEAALVANDADFAAGPTWGVATRLGFAMGRADVPALTDSIDGYDFWVEPGDYAGRDAVVLAEPGDVESLDQLRPHFETFELVETFDTERFGARMETYRIFVGRNYRP